MIWGDLGKVVVVLAFGAGVGWGVRLVVIGGSGEANILAPFTLPEDDGNIPRIINSASPATPSPRVVRSDFVSFAGRGLLM